METDEFDEEAINAMALQMVESLNYATQTTWCAMMKDRPGVDNSLELFKSALTDLVRS